jgi:hypothetical protein
MILWMVQRAMAVLKAGTHKWRQVACWNYGNSESLPSGNGTLPDARVAWKKLQAWNINQMLAA